MGREEHSTLHETMQLCIWLTGESNNASHQCGLGSDPSVHTVLINRGYYKAARKYKSSLRVLKDISLVLFTALTCEILFFQHEKRNFVSPSDYVMSYLLYKHQ